MTCTICKSETKRSVVSGGNYRPLAAGEVIFRGTGTMPDICQECWSKRLDIKGGQ